MTGREVFQLALSYIFEMTDTGTLEPFAVGWLNVLLAEALPTENSLRARDGEAALPAAPVLENLDEPVPYHMELTRVALPYGMASWMYAEDDNDYRSQDYRGRFISALAEAMRLQEGQVVDVYA